MDLDTVYGEARSRITDREYLNSLVQNDTFYRAIRESNLQLVTLLVKNADIGPNIRFLNFQIDGRPAILILKSLLQIPRLMYMHDDDIDSYFIVISNCLNSKYIRMATNVFAEANFDFTWNDSLLKVLISNNDIVYSVAKSKLRITIEKFIEWSSQIPDDAQYPLFTRIIRVPENASLFEIAVNNDLFDLADDIYHGEGANVIHMTSKILSFIVSIDDDYVIEEKYEHLINIDIFLQLVLQANLESVNKFYRKFDLNHPLIVDRIINNALMSQSEELFFFLLSVGLQFKEVLHINGKHTHTLKLVAKFGSMKILLECIKRKFNLNYDDKKTLLQEVLLRAKFDFVRLIMKRVRNLHSVFNGINVINIAVIMCGDNELDIVKYLVSRNIELELGPRQQKPLLMALHRNQISIAECLLSRLNLNDYADHFSEYPKFFIQHGYDDKYLGFKLCLESELQLLYYEIHPERINDLDEDGKNILFYQVTMEVFYFLIYNGVDIHQPRLLKYYIDAVFPLEKIFILLELGLRVDNMPPVFQEAIDLDVVKADFSVLRVYKPLFARRLMLATLPDSQSLAPELKRLILQKF